MNLERGYLKRNASTRLSGQWGLAIGVSFVAALLGGNNYVGSLSSRINLDEIRDPMVYSFVARLLLIVFAFTLVGIIVGGAVNLGHSIFYIKLIRGEYVEFSTLFSRFQYFLKALGLNLLIGLLVFLWSLLFIIPGIIAAYRYSMAFYIMAENPEISILDALNESKLMMEGNKMNLFILNLSFIGWSLLCFLTCGIGFIFLSPYINATVASFYDELSGNRFNHQPKNPNYSI